MIRQWPTESRRLATSDFKMMTRKWTRLIPVWQNTLSGNGSRLGRSFRTDNRERSARTTRAVFPAVLVLGGERSGVSAEIIGAVDTAVAIPMLGMANSLRSTSKVNVATPCFTCKRERKSIPDGQPLSSIRWLKATPKQKTSFPQGNQLS
jgi:hypothetical protein